MPKVQLRIAGLYFNEVVDMDGPGPWSVRDVMETYITKRAASQPRLSYDVAKQHDKTNDAESMLSISVTHVDNDADNALEYKFVTYDIASQSFVTTVSDRTLGGKIRREGIYRLQETPLDGGSTVVAWQYYVEEKGGTGPSRSATAPEGRFAPFGSQAAAIVQPDDRVTWRMVAFRRVPVDPGANPTS